MRVTQYSIIYNYHFEQVPLKPYPKQLEVASYGHIFFLKYSNLFPLQFPQEFCKTP